MKKAVNAEEFAEAVGKLVGAGEWIQPRFIGNDIGWELKRNADKEGPSASKEASKPFWLEKGTIDQFSRKLKSYNPNLSVKYTAEDGEGTDAEFDIVSTKSKLVLYSIQISRLGKAVFIPVRHNYVKGRLKSNSVGKPFPNPLKATDALIRMIERDKTPGYYAGETASTKETASFQPLLNQAKAKISKMSPADAVKLLVKAGPWFMLDKDEDDSYAAALKSKNSKKIAEFIVDLDPIATDDGVLAFLVENKILPEAKEEASVKEVAAKKHKSTAKMVSKISAIIQAMGMDEGQWDAVSKQVFKKAFGGKREKASINDVQESKIVKAVIGAVAKTAPKSFDEDDWDEIEGNIRSGLFRSEDGPFSIHK